MIDKYKIAKAARQISEKVVDAKGFDDSKPTHLAFLDGHVDGFNAGAKWMQEEFLKDLWHPASEKPNIKAKRKLCEIRSNLTDDEQKQAIWIAIRAIDTCTENGFIVED